MAETVKDGQQVDRKYLAHYLNATPDASQPTWVRLGEDLEDYTDEISANVETLENILGETKIKVTSYEVTGSVEPYYAYKGEVLYEWLENIARNRLTLDACKTERLTVYLWKGTADAYECDKEEVIIEVKSMGGDTNGVSIPFDVHGTNKITTGTFATSTKTFTEE